MLSIARKIEQPTLGGSEYEIALCMRLGLDGGELWPGRRPLFRTTALVTGPKPFWHQTLANTSQKALDTSNGGLRVANVCYKRLFVATRYVTLEHP